MQVGVEHTEKEPDSGREITIQQGNSFHFGEYTFQFLRVVDGSVVLHVQQHKKGTP